MKIKNILIVIFIFVGLYIVLDFNIFLLVGIITIFMVNILVILLTFP